MNRITGSEPFPLTLLVIKWPHLTGWRGIRLRRASQLYIDQRQPSASDTTPPRASALPVYTDLLLQSSPERRRAQALRTSQARKGRQRPIGEERGTGSSATTGRGRLSPSLDGGSEYRLYSVRTRRRVLTAPRRLRFRQ